MVESPFLLPRSLPLGWLASVAERLTGLRALHHHYLKRPANADSDAFLDYTLNTLGIDYEVNQADPLIPDEGSLVVVANHPLGGAEGVIIAQWLRRYRKDVKVLANQFLCRIPELAPLFIGIDVFARDAKSRQVNIRAMREAHQHVANGGVLLVFPAGEVSTYDGKGQLVDSPWQRSVVSLIKKHKAPTLPVFVQGRNSKTFYRAGKVHPLLRTLLLGRELLNKRGETITLNVGEIIPFKEIANLSDDNAVLNYLRLNTYLLPLPHDKNESKQADEAPEVASPQRSEDLLREVEYLSYTEAQLLESPPFRVFCTDAASIPHILLEIGRVREQSFRKVGEGTGTASDTDDYDSYYRHLFIWDDDKQRLVGAYRLGLVEDILEQRGIQGLYSRSLFNYSEPFLVGMGKSIEMGRSVIALDYQRSLSALLLLWKGIATYVSRHPTYTTLFGPVSISSDYPDIARQLLAETLSVHHYDESRAALVQPTHPLPANKNAPWHKGMLSALADVQLLSKVLARISQGKGVPVLLRQYLGLNGRLVCFNVDPAFHDALDGMIVVELPHVPPKTLGRYMGKEQARDYLSLHASSGPEVDDIR